GVQPEGSTNHYHKAVFGGCAVASIQPTGGENLGTHQPYLRLFKTFGNARVLARPTLLIGSPTSRYCPASLRAIPLGHIRPPVANVLFRGRFRNRRYAARRHPQECPHQLIFSHRAPAIDAALACQSGKILQASGSQSLGGHIRTSSASPDGMRSRIHRARL